MGGTIAAMKLAEWFDVQGRGAQVRMAADLGVSSTTLSLVADGSREAGLTLALEIDAYTHGAVKVDEIPLSTQGRRALTLLRSRNAAREREKKRRRHDKRGDK